MAKRHILYSGTRLLPSAFILAILLWTPARASVCPFDGQPGPARCAENELRLIRQLGSQDRSVRTLGIAALRQCGTAILPALEEGLRRSDVRERRGSVLGLVLMDMPGLGTDGLLHALSDSDATVRSLAARGLARIGAPVAGEVARLLASDRERESHGAAYALSMMRGKAVPALCDVLRSPDPAVRAKAAWLLGRMGPGALAAVPSLVRALDVNDPRALHVVAEAIDLIGPAPGVLLFHYTLLGNPPDCPTGKLGAKAAPILIRLLARPGTLTGQVAFRALAAMGRTAMPALMATLDSGAPGQRVAVALLLVKLDPEIGPELPEDVRTILVESGRLGRESE